MKLLFIAYAPLSGWRGAEQFLDRLAVDMIHRRHDVIIVAPARDYDEEATWAKLRNPPYRYRFLPMPWFTYLFSASPLIRNFMLSVDWADICYLSDLNPIFVSLLTLGGKQKPTIIGLHGLTSLNSIGAKALKRIAPVWKSLIVIHALNTAQREFFSKLGIRVVYIPSAVPRNLFVARIEVNDVFRIWFPSMEWFKGADRMLELAHLFAHRLPEVKFVVTGSGRLERTIRTVGKKLGNIELKPNLGEKELVEVYKSSNLFLCLSRSESFSRAAAEAQVNGLPVVSTPTDGPRDIVFDTELGVLLDYDLHEFSRVIGNYYQLWKNDKESYQKLKLTIAASQRPRLEWGTMVDSLEKCFVRVRMERRQSYHEA